MTEKMNILSGLSYRSKQYSVFWFTVADARKCELKVIVLAV